MEFGHLAGNFLTAFTQARQQKEQNDDAKKERDAKLKLFELELKRVQAQQASEDQRNAARTSFFSAVGGPPSATAPQGMEQASGAMPQPKMGLTDLLADPKMAMLALQGGVVDAKDLMGGAEPSDIQRLRLLMSDPKLMAAELQLRNANASRTQVSIDTGMNKPPPGYFRPDPNKPGLVPEPGGPASDEKNAAAKKASESAKAISGQTSNVIGEIDKALSLVGPLTVGLASDVSARIKGTKGYDLAKTLSTIKANIGFDKLQQMRAASPTGGALGQVAVQELEGLQASLASLDQGLGQEAITANLIKIKNHYNAWADTVKAAQSSAAANGVIDFSALPP